MGICIRNQIKLAKSLMICPQSSQGEIIPYASSAIKDMDSELLP